MESEDSQRGHLPDDTTDSAGVEGSLPGVTSSIHETARNEADGTGNEAHSPRSLRHQRREEIAEIES